MKSLTSPTLLHIAGPLPTPAKRERTKAKSIGRRCIGWLVRRLKRVNLNFNRRWRRIGVFAANKPHIKNRMFQTVEAGAFCKHPAGKYALLRIVFSYLINLDKSCCFGIFGNRGGVADLSFYHQIAELNVLPHFFFKIFGDAHNFVKTGKNRHRIFNVFGNCRRGTDRDCQAKPNKSVHCFGASGATGGLASGVVGFDVFENMAWLISDQISTAP